MFLTVLVLLAVSGIPIRRTNDIYFVKVGYGNKCGVVLWLLRCYYRYIGFLLLTVDVMQNT